MEEHSSSTTSSSKKVKQSCSSLSNQISCNIKGKTCPICLTQILYHRPAIVTNCMHAFCLRCLLRWSCFKRTCPLCISPFHSYFSTYSRFSSSFQKHHLLPLSPRRSPPPPPTPLRPRPAVVQRTLRRRREEINAVNRLSRPVPRRRFFGPVVTEERILQWRASVYKCGLSAVPFSGRNLHNLNLSASRESILRRIEPWIQRELRAILQDPDPTIIVHVATSMYLSSIEKKTKALSTSVNNQESFLAPLRPYLHEWTDQFWHELRCFAESRFTIDTYDEVIEYISEIR